MIVDPILHAWEARLALQKARESTHADAKRRGYDAHCYTSAELRELAVLAVLEWVVDEVERAR